MGLYHEDYVDVELTSGVLHRSFCDRVLGEGDNVGNQFGVAVYRNKSPENLTGASVIGYFVRPDGVTLLLSGGISGNRAYVNLPQAAYAKSGAFTLAIKVVGSGITDTLRIVDGTVANTTTGNVADPASLVPSLANLTALVSRAETAAATINALQVGLDHISGTRYGISVTKE